MNFTNSQLISFSKPVSDTEETKCKKAISMISNALKNKGFSEIQDIKLSFSNTNAYETRLKKDSREIKLLVQGSYANNTNVRASSDVDVAVIQEDVFYTEYRSGIAKEDYGFTSSNYSARQYKKDIYDDLTNYFGSGNVLWNNKCLSIEGNGYRADSDAVPARRNRDYTSDYRRDTENYISGICIVPDLGDPVINYPEQHIENGRNKNNATNSYYKKNVRILKKIRYLMKDNGIISADKVSSFMLESLLWNIPNNIFIADENYLDRFKRIINYIKANNNWNTYKEANGIKALCKDETEKSNMTSFFRDLDAFFEPAD